MYISQIMLSMLSTENQIIYLHIYIFFLDVSHTIEGGAASITHQQIDSSQGPDQAGCVVPVLNVTLHRLHTGTLKYHITIH